MLMERLEIPFRPGPPRALSLRLSEDLVTVGATVGVVARVADAYDNPLPGIPVTFTTEIGVLAGAYGRTGADGQARTSLLATTAGSGVVRAEAAGQTAFHVLVVRLVEVFLPFLVQRW
jgi:hypothetical protein